MEVIFAVSVYTIKKPKVIVLLGFTKKTQKTNKKDLETGFKALADFTENQKTIKYNFPDPLKLN